MKLAPRRIGLLALGILIVAALLFGFISLVNAKGGFSALAGNKLVYSDSALLAETWYDYTTQYLDASTGRTYDDLTTKSTSSNGQSLTLLRAVFVDDKSDFDKSWNWSKTTDMGPNDLFYAHYYQYSGITDTSSDSGADTTTALSLLMAYRRWGDQHYLQAAEATLVNIYDHEVQTVDGSPLLTGSDATSATTATLTLDTADFNVAAFKEFAKVDPTHDWTGLSDNSYRVLADVVKQNDGVMPDSFTIDRTTGTITTDLASNTFGADAATTIWNVGLDYSWTKDLRDIALFSQIGALNDQFEQSGSVRTATGAQTSATYGKLMALFLATDQQNAQTDFKTHLESLYDQDQQTWRDRLSLSDDTWAWLGIALHEGALPELTEGM